MAFTVSRRQWCALSIVIFLLLVLVDLSVQTRTLVEDATSDEERSLVGEDSKVGVDPRDPRRVARRCDHGWDRGGWNGGGGWDEGGNWNESGGWNNRPPWDCRGGGRRK